METDGSLIIFSTVLVMMFGNGGGAGLFSVKIVVVLFLSPDCGKEPTKGGLFFESKYNSANILFLMPAKSTIVVLIKSAILILVSNKKSANQIGEEAII